MRKKKLLIIIGLVAAAVSAFVLVPRGADKSDDGRPVVRVVMLYPMTGDMAAFGDVNRRVIDAFMPEWKAQNPDAKYRYEIIWEDVQFSTARAVTIMHRFARNQRADAVVSIFSGMALAINPIINRHRIINLNYTLDPATSDGDFAFRLTLDMEAAIDKLLSRVQAQGVNKIAVIGGSDVANTILYDTIVRQANARDTLTLGPTFRIRPGEQNFDVMVRQIRQSGAGMVVMQLMPPDSDRFITAMRRNNLNIPVTGQQTIGLVTDKSLVEGMWEVRDVTATPEWLDRFGGVLGRTDTYYAEATYMMINILVNAWEMADAAPGEKPTPEAVAESMIRNTAGLRTSLATLRTDDDGNILVPTVIREIRDGRSVAPAGDQ
ncbi:MAG: ABC transporter substrate-binding protein [Alphaproteobacteria bacterium]|nr:ABC transporter substrate-binding protein [Alphaproteobacteria bacterium]MCL2757912.1 ABC transporter substrate-binding protein [Alphaproteobacteria bacterium]